MSSKEIKEKIIKDIDRLPESSLKEIMDFVNFLLSKNDDKKKNKTKDKIRNHKKLDPSKDPLLKFIGSIDVEPFAHNIDNELYGEIK